VIDRIAAVWNTGWNLEPGVDVARFPSSGPYKIDSVRDDGAVVLVANDRWWGTRAITPRITVFQRGLYVQDRVNDGTFDVVDVATGSSGTLTTPDNYERTDSPSTGIEQMIFAPQGAVSQTPERRALALCTPRDVIARNAEVPVSNARLNPVNEDTLALTENVPAAGEFMTSNPVAAREALAGRPLTVRIGYQTPNARLAATVGAIAKACEPAGITVTDASSDVAGSPAPAAPPAAARPARRWWTRTPCSPATATTCPGMPTVRSTASSARWRSPRIPRSRRGSTARAPRSCGLICRPCRCTVSSAR
jgi:peptide/nickel transport system substrate-binding protein